MNYKYTCISWLCKISFKKIQKLLHIWFSLLTEWLLVSCTWPAFTGVVTLFVLTDGAVEAGFGVTWWYWGLTVSASEGCLRAVTAQGFRNDMKKVKYTIFLQSVFKGVATLNLLKHFYKANLIFKTWHKRQFLLFSQATYSFTPSIHRAPLRHGRSWHSSMSISHWWPWKPDRQVHVKPPV